MQCFAFDVCVIIVLLVGQGTCVEVEDEAAVIDGEA